MYYTAEKMDHGLPYNPFKAIVSPRPIAWVSTIDKDDRVNLAPYSFFNGLSDVPPIIGFSCGPSKPDGSVKDSIRGIRDTGEFCVSIVSSALKDAMNITSGHYEAGKDEFELAGLEKGASKIVKPPFVAASPASMECRLHSMIELPGGYTWIIGMVEAFHLDDTCIKDGIFDVTSYQPLSRLGYKDYSNVERLFSLKRPDED